jgi:glutamyl-tRNA synthetase
MSDVSSTKPVRVRYAPSPTGYLHIGGLRTALYNVFFARRHGGVFLLRMEDTDQARLVPGAVDALLRTFATLGITADEGPYLTDDGIVSERGAYGPYTQSRRLHLYREYAELLITKGQAYRCFCSAETLEAMRTEAQAAGRPTRYDGRCRTLSTEVQEKRMSEGPHVIRMCVPPTGTISWIDQVRGEISFSVTDIEDAVLIKTDGFPTYHLANVIDDHLMEISHVIRGEEWIASTPKHVLLYQAFGWDAPLFGHLPLLLNSDRTKLSKRQGDVAVEDYLRRGYLPEALLNFVALLGWNPTADRELFAMDELGRLFDLSKVNATGAVVNFEKLDWMNRQYFKELSSEDFARRAAPFLVAAGILVADGANHWTTKETGKEYTPAELARVVELERERISALEELPKALHFVFAPLVHQAEMLCWKGMSAVDTTARLGAVRRFLAEQADLSVAALEAATKTWIAEQGWGNGEVLWPLRVALSGQEKSPGPFDMIAAFGKEESLRRLEAALQTLRQ